MKFKLLRRLAGKIYLFAKFEGEKLLNEARLKVFQSNAKIGEGTRCANDATIKNGSNNPAKISIGRNCWIQGYLLVYNDKGKITVGDDTFIGPGTKVWSAKEINIGSRVLISHDVNIHDNNSHPQDAIERANHFKNIFANSPYDGNFEFGGNSITIGDDVWIGFNVTIMKGVTIGKGAIIGANTMITKNVEEYAVVVEQENTRVVRYVYPKQ